MKGIDKLKAILHQAGQGGGGGGPKGLTLADEIFTVLMKRTKLETGHDGINALRSLDVLGRCIGDILATVPKGSEMREEMTGVAITAMLLKIAYWEQAGTHRFTGVKAFDPTGEQEVPMSDFLKALKKEKPDGPLEI